MKFPHHVKLFKPTKIKAEYRYNTDYNIVTGEHNDRFNCPWENKLVIEGELLGETSVNIDIYCNTNYFSCINTDEIIKKIIKYYESEKITIYIKNVQFFEIIISDESLKDALISWKEYDAIKKLGDIYQRGISIPKDSKYRIFISIEGCKGTIWRDEEKFKDGYAEYHKMLPWSLKGFVFYVLAHEIGHAMIPLEKENGGEIWPIILGSIFAANNNYIYVPQGRELNIAWRTVGIILSKKLDRDTRDGRLIDCKRWLEDLPTNKEYKAYIDNLKGGF